MCTWKWADRFSVGAADAKKTMNLPHPYSVIRVGSLGVQNEA